MILLNKSLTRSWYDSFVSSEQIQNCLNSSINSFSCEIFDLAWNYSGLHYCLFVKVLCCLLFSSLSDNFYRLSHFFLFVNNFFHFLSTFFKFRIWISCLTGQRMWVYHPFRLLSTLYFNFLNFSCNSYFSSQAPKWGKAYALMPSFLPYAVISVPMGRAFCASFKFSLTTSQIIFLMGRHLFASFKFSLTTNRLLFLMGRRLITSFNFSLTTSRGMGSS